MVFLYFVPCRASTPKSSFSIAVKITGCDLATIEGRDIMIVEDIVDTGATLRKLIPVLQAGALSTFLCIWAHSFTQFYSVQEHNPRSIKVITFLEKRTTRSSGFLAEYVAFSIPDHFIIGMFSFPRNCCLLRSKND